MRQRATRGPEFVRYLDPVLKALQDLGGSGRPAEVRDIVASKLSVTDEQRSELMESGSPRFDNQVAFARFYLAKAGLVDASQRGVWALTDKGRAQKSLTQEEALSLFADIHARFKQRDGSNTGEGERDQTNAAGDADTDLTPEEQAAVQSADYKTRLLNLMRSLPPAGFERLCQRLLREAGFAQVTVTGKSGDGGIDGTGVLQINPFVSFKVIFQCKRYAGPVSSSQMRDFRGAMTGRADKGIILTTGTFTLDAQREAVRDGAPPIELVDGSKLADMFEQLELGLVPRKTYDLDEAFFDEYRS